MPEEREPFESSPGSSEYSPEPYKELTDPSYKEFATTCTVVETKAGVRLVGKCPRCDHAMSYPWPKKVVGRRIRRQRDTRDAGGRELRMLCLCTEEHPGRPEKGHGCGAYWNVLLDNSTT